MSLFDDKYNNNKTRKSMGDEIFDDIGSALPFAKKASEKITGHTVEEDMKKLKGYSDSEYEGMSVEQLLKLKKAYTWRSLGLILAIIFIVNGVSKYPSGFFEALLGVVFLIISLRAIKQYMKIKKYLDMYK